MPFSICLSLVLLAGGCAPPELLSEGLGEPDFPFETARSANDFVNSVGVGVHLSYFTTPYGVHWVSFVKPKLLELGVRHLRDGGSVVSDDAWMRTVYGRMNELAAQGLRFNLVMAPASGTQDYARLTHFDRLLSFVGTAAESFEGLNEHDLTGRPDWAAETRSFQQALYAAVKANPATRELAVLGPSLGRPERASSVGDLSPYMDFGSIHPYPGGEVPTAGISRHSDQMKAIARQRPLVASETGYHTAQGWTGEHPPISEAAMARYVPRLLLEYFNAGIQRTWLYEFVDQGMDSTQREQAFGLLRADGSEKPVYQALRNLLRLLSDPGAPHRLRSLRFKLSGDLASVRHTLLQKRNGRFYLILWQDVASFDLATRADIVVPARPIQLELAAPASSIRVFDPLTSPDPQLQAEGIATLPLEVSDTPLVLEITR